MILKKLLNSKKNLFKLSNNMLNLLKIITWEKPNYIFKIIKISKSKERKATTLKLWKEMGDNSEQIKLEKIKFNNCHNNNKTNSNNNKTL